MKKSLNNYINSLVNKIINETIEERADELVTKLTEGDKMVCEQCGKEMMTEGICEQCSSMKESNELDYVAEEEEFGSDPAGMINKFCDTSSDEYNDAACKYHEERFMGGGEMSEKLHGRQSKIDVAEPKGKITGADFKKLRSMKKETDEEVEEGNAFTGALAKAKKEGDKTFEVGGKKFNVQEKWEGDVEVEKTEEHSDKSIEEINSEIKKLKEKTSKLQDEGKKVPKSMREKMSELYFAKRAKQDWPGKGKSKVKESIQMTESEMIDFIEKIVLQEEKKLKSMGKTKGMNVYQKSHTASGKENKEYLQSVVKKMKDYLKDGSKSEYDMNPEIFPKGNGELAKMDKKAYNPSDAVKDYTDNFTAAGLENLDYDEIQPNEDWVTDNIEGSSKTGNNPEWVNTGKSDVNKKRNKIRKDNMLAKVKRKAYNKAPQPIVQDTQDGEKANKILMKLESVDEKTTKQINEEFERMKNLIGYNQKTQ